MAADQSIRASDDDRERVVEILRQQVVEGRLTFEEFEERTDAAYTAKTWGELRDLVNDLPVRVVFAADERGGTRSAERAGPVQRMRKAGVPVRPPMVLVPAVLAGVVLVIAIAGAWEVLPFALIGVFWFGMGPCRPRGRASSGSSCGGAQSSRPIQITPPRG